MVKKVKTTNSTTKSTSKEIGTNKDPLNTNITDLIPSVFVEAAQEFETIANLEGLLGTHRASSTLQLDSTNFVSFNKPTEVLISRWYPGYRLPDLTGEGADEALGYLLAHQLQDKEALYAFQQILSNPTVASTVINLLLPRKGYAVKRGVYLMSQDSIGDTVRLVLGNMGEDRFAIVASITHLLTRILAKLDLVLPSAEQKIVMMSDSLAISVSDIRRLIMVESLRDIFSDARIAEVSRQLDQDSTPEVIAEVVGRTLRHASNAIPEITLRMEQIGMVQALVHRWHVNPRSLTNVMQAYSGLSALANYANFAIWSSYNNLQEDITADNSDLKEAVNNILTLIQSAPSIESIPLAKFAEYFGAVPASAAGIYRGLVCYLPLSQQSKMDVVQYKPQADGYLVALQPQEYTPISRIAEEINKGLLSVTAMEGLANLVADEIAMQPFQLGDEPLMYTMGVSKDDIRYLALNYAQTVSFVLYTHDGPALPQVVYGVDVAEQFISRVGAASPGTAFFSDPISVLTYSFGSRMDPVPVLPTPMSSRNQSWNLSVGTDHNIKSEVKKLLSSRIEEAFKVTLPLELMQVDGEPTLLDIVLTVLPILLPNPNEDGVIDLVESGGVHFASVKEPGVDRDCQMLLALAARYTKSGNRVLADKAKSWVIEVLGVAMQHPVIVSTATKAVNRTLISNRIDGRRLRSQFKDIMVLAYFSTLMAALNKFNKVDSTTTELLINSIPVSGLSVKASALLMSMPSQLSASALVNN